MFWFSLLCPDAEVWSGQAEHVVAPGVEGEFGVLPGHCAFVSTLDDGVVRMLDAGGAEVKRFCVRGGIAEVADDSMVILADEAVDVVLLDAGEVASRLAEAPDEQHGWLTVLSKEAERSKGAGQG